MADFLERMARASLRRAAEARQRTSEARVRERCGSLPPAPRLELDAGGFDLLAEIKRRSPAAGALAAHESIAGRAAAYSRAGAAAISVLTEPEAFHGSLADLEEASRAVAIPALRKDFLVDPYQVLEARAHGAGGVLLILRLLDSRRLAEMLDAAGRAGLFVLLEAFDAEDLARAGQVAAAAPAGGPPLLVGLNARDLQTLAVDRERLRRLRPALPAGVPAVAESGISGVDEARDAAALGYRAILVGAALMRAADPERLAAALLRAGRAQASPCA